MNILNQWMNFWLYRVSYLIITVKGAYNILYIIIILFALTNNTFVAIFLL